MCNSFEQIPVPTRIRRFVLVCTSTGAMHVKSVCQSHKVGASSDVGMYASSFNQEEDEVPDDETLNQMIARNEDEFELFMVRNYLFIICFLFFTSGKCMFYNISNL